LGGLIDLTCFAATGTILVLMDLLALNPETGLAPAIAGCFSNSSSALASIAALSLLGCVVAV
jgi:hypothetical protein